MEVLDATPYTLRSPAAFMECADTLLVLTNNKAVLAHRAILSNHSTVLCDMLNHNAATLKPGYKLKVPFLDFAEDETFTLLAYLYATSPSFPSVDAALVVARFSHKFDAPDALRRAEVYLIDYISSSIFATEARLDTALYDDLLRTALASESLGMPELMAHCERVIALHWRNFENWSQLSSTALACIASGISAALMSMKSSIEYGSIIVEPKPCQCPVTKSKYESDPTKCYICHEARASSFVESTPRQSILLYRNFRPGRVSLHRERSTSSVRYDF